MASKGTPGEHLAEAREILKALEPVTSQGAAGEAHTRATAAVAHAVLALAEQVAMLRHQLGGATPSDRSEPSDY